MVEGAGTAGGLASREGTPIYGKQSQRGFSASRGLEDGIRSDLEIAVASRVTNLLSMDPTVGSQSAQELLKSFRAEAGDAPRAPNRTKTEPVPLGAAAEATLIALGVCEGASEMAKKTRPHSTVFVSLKLKVDLQTPDDWRADYFLWGQTPPTSGLFRRDYAKEGSEDERLAREALVRVLRKPEPLSRTIRSRLDGII